MRDWIDRVYRVGSIEADDEAAFKTAGRFFFFREGGEVGEGE